MSDDEADPELVALLRERLGLNPPPADAPPETKVLESAAYVYDNSIDVALDMRGTKAAAEVIWTRMQKKQYSTKAWAEHELHPKPKDEWDDDVVNFIFTMDLLNFSFWSEKDEQERFQVEWNGKKWTGYWSLVAALQRAISEDIPITSPTYWISEECTDDSIRNVFRSETDEDIPLLQERIDLLREAGHVLQEKFEGSVVNLVKDAKGSAAGLVNLLAKRFAAFDDSIKFERRVVRFLKRAQIFVADLWAAFEGAGHGSFDDIEKITVFADYRIPQMLQSMGVMSYSPSLDGRIRRKGLIEPGHSWEIQIRGCTIHAVELLRREIIRQHPEATVNTILIDFFLYDTSKEMEKEGVLEMIPHHRTRSIWY